MTCKVCGATVADDAKFCDNCGNKIEETVNEVNTETVEEESYKEPERVEAEVVSEGSAQTNNTTNEDVAPQNNADNSEKGPQGYSIASLVCGILGLFCCCCGWIGLIVSIAGVVLGVIALNKNCEGRGMAIAGIVCGGLGALVALIGVIVAAASGNLVEGLGDLDQISDFLDSL